MLPDDVVVGERWGKPTGVEPAGVFPSESSSREWLRPDGGIVSARPASAPIARGDRMRDLKRPAPDRVGSVVAVLDALAHGVHVDAIGKTVAEETRAIRPTIP